MFCLVLSTELPSRGENHHALQKTKEKEVGIITGITKRRVENHTSGAETGNLNEKDTPRLGKKIIIIKKEKKEKDKVKDTARAYHMVLRLILWCFLTISGRHPYGYYYLSVIRKFIG